MIDKDEVYQYFQKLQMLSIRIDKEMDKKIDEYFANKNKERKWLKMPKDKILHFIAGFLITVIFSYMAYIQGFDYPQSYGIALGVCAGVGKEAFDYYDYGRFDFFDMMATFIGVFIGGALVVIL